MYWVSTSEITCTNYHISVEYLVPCTSSNNVLVSLLLTMSRIQCGPPPQHPLSSLSASQLHFWGSCHSLGLYVCIHCSDVKAQGLQKLFIQEHRFAFQIFLVLTSSGLEKDQKLLLRCILPWPLRKDKINFGCWSLILFRSHSLQIVLVLFPSKNL